MLKLKNKHTATEKLKKKDTLDHSLTLVNGFCYAKQTLVEENMT